MRFLALAAAAALSTTLVLSSAPAFAIGGAGGAGANGTGTNGDTGMPSTLDRSELPPPRPAGFTVNNGDGGRGNPAASGVKTIGTDYSVPPNTPLSRALATNRRASNAQMSQPIKVNRDSSGRVKSVSVGKATYDGKTGKQTNNSNGNRNGKKK